MAQGGTHLLSRHLHDALGLMPEKDIDKVEERRIVEHAALHELVAVEGHVVVVDDLRDDGELRALRLENDETALAFAPGTPCQMCIDYIWFIVFSEVLLFVVGL